MSTMTPEQLDKIDSYWRLHAKEDDQAAVDIIALVAAVRERDAEIEPLKIIVAAAVRMKGCIEVDDDYGDGDGDPPVSVFEGLGTAVRDFEVAIGERVTGGDSVWEHLDTELTALRSRVAALEAVRVAAERFVVAESVSGTGALGEITALETFRQLKTALSAAQGDAIGITVVADPTMPEGKAVMVSATGERVEMVNIGKPGAARGE